MWARLCLHPLPNSCCAWIILLPTPISLLYAQTELSFWVCKQQPNILLHTSTLAAYTFFSSNRFICFQRCLLMGLGNLKPTSHGYVDSVLIPTLCQGSLQNCHGRTSSFTRDPLCRQDSDLNTANRQLRCQHTFLSLLCQERSRVHTVKAIQGSFMFFSPFVVHSVFLGRQVHVFRLPLTPI